MTSTYILASGLQPKSGLAIRNMQTASNTTVKCLLEVGGISETFNACTTLSGTPGAYTFHWSLLSGNRLRVAIDSTNPGGYTGGRCSHCRVPPTGPQLLHVDGCYSEWECCFQHAPSQAHCWMRSCVQTLYSSIWIPYGRTHPRDHACAWLQAGAWARRAAAGWCLAMASSSRPTRRRPAGRLWQTTTSAATAPAK